jgi:hypothetical protein
VPLTYFSQDGNDPLNIKVYGDGVWNRWIDSHYGPEVVRDSWAVSRKTKPKSFAPAAYDATLKAKGTSFVQAFTSFTTDTAEWRAANTAFAEGPTFPDVDRAASDSTGRPITLTPEDVGATGALDHTAYVLLDVRPTPGMPRLRLAVTAPRGAHMAIALVGRTGDEVRGHATEFITPLTKGGPGVITIDNPNQYDRLTAVVVNADATASRFSRTLGDWVWEHDAQHINARVSADFAAPSLRRRSPTPGSHHASTRTRVIATFSDRMFELTRNTVKLIGPGGHSVKASLALTTKGRRTKSGSGADKVVLTPRTRLRNGVRYEVRLSRDLRDYGGNALPASALRWSFVTKR